MPNLQQVQSKEHKRIFLPLFGIRKTYGMLLLKAGACLLILLAASPAIFAYSSDEALSRSQSLELCHKAGILSSQKLYREAQDLLIKACDLNPFSEIAWRNLGQVLRAQGKFDEAIQAYKRALGVDPTDLQTIENIGLCYCEKGDFKEAKVWLESFLNLKLHGKDVAIIRERLARLEEIKDDQSREDYFNGSQVSRWLSKNLPLKIAVVLEPHLALSKDKLTDLVSQAAKSWSQASDGYLNFVISNDDKNAHIRIYFQKGIITGPYEINLHSGDNFGESNYLGILERATIKIPVSPTSTTKDLAHVCLHELGHALGLQGHSASPGDVMFPWTVPSSRDVVSSRDKKTLRRLYGIDNSKQKEINVEESLSPKQNVANPADYCELGRLNLNSGKTTEAIMQFTKACLLEANYPEAYCGRAISRLRLGDLPGALADSTETIKQDANNSYAYLLRASILSMLAEYEKAIQDIDVSIALDPRQADAYMQRGLAYDKLGRKEEANSNFQAALGMYKDTGQIARLQAALEQIKALRAQESRNK